MPMKNFSDTIFAVA